VKDGNGKSPRWSANPKTIAGLQRSIEAGPARNAKAVERFARKLEGPRLDLMTSSKFAVPEVQLDKIDKSLRAIQDAMVDTGVTSKIAREMARLAETPIPKIPMPQLTDLADAAKKLAADTARQSDYVVRLPRYDTANLQLEAIDRVSDEVVALREAQIQSDQHLERTTQLLAELVEATRKGDQFLEPDRLAGRRGRPRRRPCRVCDQGPWRLARIGDGVRHSRPDRSLYAMPGVQDDDPAAGRRVLDRRGHALGGMDGALQTVRSRRSVRARGGAA
jgi:hypothetical protein